MSSCAFGGRRCALIVGDGGIVIREKSVKDDIASFPPCGALSIALSEDGDFVAVGNESGCVLVWNVLTHQQQILSTSSTAPVTAVGFIGPSLYSTQQGKLYEWNMEGSGEVKETFKLDKKAKVTCLARGVDKSILVASRKIKSLSLKTGETEADFDGAATECVALASRGGALMVAAGRDEKKATVYQTSSGEVECRLQLTRSAKHIDINGRQIIVLNSSEGSENNGSGNQVDMFTAGTKNNKMIKAKKSLNISDEQGDQVTIYAVRFMEHDAKSTKCDVIYGAPASLTWEEIDIDGQINLERHVISRKVVTATKRRKDEVEKKVERLTGENAHSKSRKRQESINESEMTMAERLGLNGAEAKDLKAGSITNILQQALHARDKKQLAKILNHTDQALIKETVKNVPPPLAPVLMTEVCHRLQSAPERALASSRWLRTTLQYHSAPLAAASNSALETTIPPLQLRTSAFVGLKQLQGKLELAIATAKLSDGDSGDDGPLVMLNDVTDIDDHSHSESDWENEFTHEGRAGSESGAESENEPKRRKMEN